MGFRNISLLVKKIYISGVCMFRILFFSLTVVTLAGCVSPMRLGISEAEWRNYSPDEQQKIKSGYYEMLRSRVSGDEERIEPDGSTLHVKVSDGQVKMPPFTSLLNYNPLEFDIQSGDCQTIEITQQGGDKKVPMKVCHINKTLYLDPSRYDPSKKLGSIQLHYSPIWDRGFTYQNVSSSGYVHLTNVNVAVRKYENNERSNSEN